MTSDDKVIDVTIIKDHDWIQARIMVNRIRYMFKSKMGLEDVTTIVLDDKTQLVVTDNIDIVTYKIKAT